MQSETGIEFPLIEAVGEDVPLPDASFDLVHSEYGAALWADPYKWIPEAARLLRPSGWLVFMSNSTLCALCMAMDGVTEQLQRPQRGLHRDEWPDTHEVEFHLSHSDWIDLLHTQGFDVVRLIELFAPEDAQTHSYYNYVTPEWGRQWPAAGDERGLGHGRVRQGPRALRSTHRCAPRARRQRSPWLA